MLTVMEERGIPTWDGPGFARHAGGAHHYSLARGPLVLPVSAGRTRRSGGGEAAGAGAPCVWARSRA
eukprot:4556329-Prymnesium_polylepis.1